MKLGEARRRNQRRVPNGARRFSSFINMQTGAHSLISTPPEPCGCDTIELMMGYYGCGGSMMGWGGGLAGSLGLLTWLVFLVAGVLLCIWLWQQITKKISV